MSSQLQELEETQVVTRKRPVVASQSQKLPIYKLILHNDDYNSFGFVIRILVQVIPCTTMKATWLALQAHNKGRTIIWSGSLEVAELKADQIKAFGADPLADQEKVKPLQVTIEAE